MHTIQEVLERGQQLDVRAKVAVELDIQQEGRMIYLNIDGVTACRILVEPGVTIPIVNSRRATVEEKKPL